MQRSVSRDHLPSNQESPASVQNSSPAPLLQSLSSFDNPNFQQHNKSKKDYGPSQLSTCWKVTFIVSSIFANGIAAASLLYIWKFCNC